jgi:putative transposase
VIWELRHEHKVTLLLEASELPRSSYYYYIKQKDKPDKYSEVKEAMKELFKENEERVGYRRMTLELQRLKYVINHKTVKRLMDEVGLFCRVRMKRYNSYKGTVGEVAPNVLERNFKADKPNQKWVTDVTEFSLYGQKIYLSPILDLCNGEIVAYDISNSPNFKQTLDMLDKAFKKVTNTEGLILHSDQGWQYQMKHYQYRLKSKGVIQSMSRKGNCLDNAVIENFFGHVKCELLYLRKFSSMEEFKDALIRYLDYYNNRRIKLTLGGLTPVEYRLKFAA